MNYLNGHGHCPLCGEEDQLAGQAAILIKAGILPRVERSRMETGWVVGGLKVGNGSNMARALFLAEVPEEECRRLFDENNADWDD